jgi:hypothetical protein
MTRSSSSRVFAPVHTGRPAELHEPISVLDRQFQDMPGCTGQMIQEYMHIQAKRKLMHSRATLDQISYGLRSEHARYYSRMFKQTEPSRLFRPAVNLAWVLMRDKS